MGFSLSPALSRAHTVTAFDVRSRARELSVMKRVLEYYLNFMISVAREDADDESNLN